MHIDVRCKQVSGSGKSVVVLVALLLLLGIASSLLAQSMFGYKSPTLLLAFCLLVFFVAVPEITLALFLFAGAIKGAPGFSDAVPFDLTVGLAALLITSCVVIVLFRRGPIRLPGVYLLYVPLLLLMWISLFYTPQFAMGLDKTLRFMILTGTAIIGPFVILETPSQLRRFLLTNVACAVVVTLTSFSMLGGNARLVAPSGLTIQLAYKTGLALVIIWTMVFPGLPFRRRCLWYPVVAVLLIGLLGSGGRAAMIATCACFGVGLYSYRYLVVDLAIGGILGAFALPSVPIPDASYAYLATLINESPHQVLGFRDELTALAMRLTIDHPFGGVGVGGYPSLSPNPSEYTSPHNILLEISSEMGMIALVLFLSLLMWAFWKIIGQTRADSVQDRIFARVILAMLMFSLISAMASGDINDNRSMWLCIGLPFVLANLSKRHAAASVSVMTVDNR